ncbi:uncharacterized protein C1orf50 homolog [Anopheles ziemanni]|uniref:uncharacterized protein C1orf50 homolog n=1 Tax=Anopheles coustani TaxID=139045 RepID=UPI002657E904|nr:uncharacterized protein C1orf50 homolog [Anopheles coustani]XP_058168553.1 uncharacterized protein C1orf50 homolog [Anopheles ziemanni]
MKRMALETTSKEYQDALSKVTLVERNPAPNGTAIVSMYRTGVREADDIVTLAKEIQSADIAVTNNACAKLVMIAEQVRFLQQQAKKILEETQAAQELHHAACNFRKIPGHIYHLYKRASGQTYFSMLSPDEWGPKGCEHQYLGSYKLEHDQTWTPIEKIEKVQENIRWAHRVLDAGLNTNRSNFLSIDEAGANDDKMES